MLAALAAVAAVAAGVRVVLLRMLFLMGTVLYVKLAMAWGLRAMEGATRLTPPHTSVEDAESDISLPAIAWWRLAFVAAFHTESGLVLAVGVALQGEAKHPLYIDLVLGFWVLALMLVHLAFAWLPFGKSAVFFSTSVHAHVIGPLTMNKLSAVADACLTTTACVSDRSFVSARDL